MTSPYPACSIAPFAASPRSGATWRPGVTGRVASPRRCARAWTVAAARSAPAIVPPSWRETYQELDEAGRKEFLRTLASFDSDAECSGRGLRRGAGSGRSGRAGHRQGGAAARAGTAAAAAADAVHHHPRRPEVPGRPARLPAEGAPRRQAAGGAGGRPARPARGLVRHRLPRAAPHRLEQPGRAAREAGRLRGGARDPLAGAI